MCGVRDDLQVFLGIWAVVVMQTGMGNDRGRVGFVVDKGIILS